MVFKKLFKILKKALGKKRKLIRKKRLSAKRRQRKKKFRKKKLKSVVRRRPKRKISKRRKKILKVSKKGKKTDESAVLIGVVTHYFPRVNAAVVKLKKTISLGMPIWIKGKSTDLRQTVGSLQINRNPVESAKAGAEIGLEVFREVKAGDMILESS